MTASTSATAALPALSHFRFTLQGPIAHLQLVQPERMNAMSPGFWRELDAVLQHLQHHPDARPARALVISSSGKHFCAGMALETFANPGFAPDDRSPEGRSALAEMLWDMQATLTRIEQLRMPVIAAIQGGCVGGALDLVACACIRYATQDAFFCVQEINIGMVADIGSLQRLPKLLPMGLVKELAYTGRRWPAAQALQHGFVNAVLDSPEAALQAAMDCAREIAQHPPVAIWGSKQALHYARDHSVEDSLRQMGWLQSGIWSNRHVMEAVQAGQQKREASFPDTGGYPRFGQLDAT
ncbi:MAG: enoyl-CoA hydratase/isomerase family protein [Acidovorax sp.]|jgi:enoyl-CoA hydratase|nr:enoyl-CoA hydratase/isomerase family protein [Acidovorax sp.]